jgi:large subunit ribosomal protein L6
MQLPKNYQSEIKLPHNINIEKKNNFLIFSGPLGSSKINMKKLDKKGFGALFINKEEKSILLRSPIESFFKSLESIITNKINGVSQGFLVYLRIMGIGYRATLEENRLLMKCGYSHDVEYVIPKSIRIFLIEPTLICLFGIDKNQVSQIAAKIRAIKPPSPYKGKGIRLLHEKVQIKQGKQK